MIVCVDCLAMKHLRKLNLNSTRLSALTFEGLKVGIDFTLTTTLWYLYEKVNCMESEYVQYYCSIRFAQFLMGKLCFLPHSYDPGQLSLVIPPWIGAMSTG